MTREETKIICAMIDAAFPNWHPKDLRLTVDLWASTLKDYPLDEVEQGLRAFISSDRTGFAPTPGQVIGQIQDIRGAGALTPGEAWGLVLKAIERSSYYSVEEYQKLPEDVQRAVGGPETLRAWAREEHGNLGATRAIFERSYTTTINRRKWAASIPEEAWKRLEKARVMALGVRADGD